MQFDLDSFIPFTNIATVAIPLHLDSLDIILILSVVKMFLVWKSELIETIGIGVCCYGIYYFGSC